MTTPRSIFRAAALAQQQAPEDLERLLQMPSPPVWSDVVALGGRVGAMVRRRGPRRRTPTVLQMEAAECGAAALGMILGYYGRHVSLEALRSACGVSRDGSRAANILRAARGYGLVAAGHRTSVESLRAAPLPVIVFWRFSHFVVVEGFGRESVYLNDPATGQRTVTHAEFDGAFTGIVLTFRPGPDFRPGPSRPSLIGALRRRLAGSAVGLAGAVLASLALAVPGLLLPLVARAFVDGYLVAGNRQIVVPVLVGLALTAAGRAFLTWLQQDQLLRLETKLALAGAGQFFQHVLRLPLGFFSQRFAGEIGARVELNDRVAHLLAGEVATAALNVLVAAGCAAAMWRYDPLLALVALAVAAVNLLFLRALNRAQADGGRRLLQERGRLVGVSVAGLQMVEALKASGQEAAFFARWSGIQARLVGAEAALGGAGRALEVVPPALGALGNAAVLIIGALRVMDGALSVGTLVAFQGLLAGCLDPVGRLVRLGGMVQEMAGDLERLDDVLRHPVDGPPVDAPPAAGAPLADEDVDVDVAAPAAGEAQRAPLAGHRLSGQVTVRGLSFGYSRLDPPLLQACDLTVEAGQWVALVGETGSGKSTLARLVCGLYRPWQGEVRFDGRSRDRLTRAELAATLAFVDQEIVLFDGTVRENLSLWDATVSETALIRAARDACIHTDVLRRPGGYDGPVEQAGRNFSGGQRQRLEIARALARDPRLLVLDEATSALDPLVESTVMANLRRRGCACLIVAHRLSTVRDCDEIVVLHAGRVIERGTHNTLLGRGGAYTRLAAAETGPANPGASAPPDSRVAPPPFENRPSTRDVWRDHVEVGR